MTTEHILSLLIVERDKLNKAIAALGGSKPAATPVATVPAPAKAKRKKRRALTEAQKKAHADRMREYWAARRKKT